MNGKPERCLRVILNGKSAGDESVRKAVHDLRESGCTVQVRVTWESGDAARYAAEAISSGVDVVIAGGGDGTINEVVSGILETDSPRDVAIGVLPLGTANDFSRGCGIPVNNPLAALKLATSGPIRDIDVGKVNDRYFINVASGGFGAEVTANTPKPLKKLMGGAAYTLAGIASAPRLKPYHVTLTLGDGSRFVGRVYFMAVGNGRQAGGGQQVTPQALLDDGLLDLAVVHDLDLSSIGTLYNELVNIEDSENRNISYLQASEFLIESETPMQVNLDGEPIKATTFLFQVLPAAVRFVVSEQAEPFCQNS